MAAQSEASWIQVAATIGSGLLISLVVTYFQADRFRLLVNRFSERLWVGIRDHPFLAGWTPALGLAIWVAVLVFPGGSTRVLGAALTWAVALALTLLVTKPRALRASISPAKTDALRWITAVRDASTETAEHSDSPVFKVDRGDETRSYLYFRFARPQARAFRRAGTVLFLVECAASDELGEAPRLNFHLQADCGRDASYRRCWAQRIVGEGTWRWAVFPVHGGRFRGRQNQGADFRLNVDRETELLVRTIAVLALPC
jgi:hypothetical protein